MKNELKFYTSLPLFVLTTCFMWGMTLPITFCLVLFCDVYDFAWWVSVILLYGLSIAIPILIYPVTMSKIHLNEMGITKTVFKKSKAQFIKWEDVCDVQILTRPNGYAYVIISNNKINAKSFEEVIKEKNIIYFTYNDKAVEFINYKIMNKDLRI